MRGCDRCGSVPVAGRRKDFFFCLRCLPAIDAQIQLNEATVHMTSAAQAIARAQDHLDEQTPHDNVRQMRRPG